MSNPAGSLLGEKVFKAKSRKESLIKELLKELERCVQVSNWTNQLDRNGRLVPEHAWMGLMVVFDKIKTSGEYK